MNVVDGCVKRYHDKTGVSYRCEFCARHTSQSAGLATLACAYMEQFAIWG